MPGELYDPVANPYVPGAGTPPPALVGRDDVIDIADVALWCLRSARASQHIFITGLRSVGKTVLLGKLTALAEHVGYRAIRVEALGGDDTIRSFLRQARRIVEEFASFFAARIARTPASEVAYVQALASLGPGPHRSGEVAAAAGKSTPQVTAFRDRLIAEDVIYAPRYGWVGFAIPHLDRYVRNVLPTQH
jgi:hypothetical protein